MGCFSWLEAFNPYVQEWTWTSLKLDCRKLSSREIIPFSHGIGNNLEENLQPNWTEDASELTDRRKAAAGQAGGQCDFSTLRQGQGHGWSQVGNLPWGFRNYLWPVGKVETEDTSFTRSWSKCPKTSLCLDMWGAEFKWDLLAQRVTVTAQWYCQMPAVKCSGANSHPTIAKNHPT